MSVFEYRTDLSTRCEICICEILYNDDEFVLRFYHDYFAKTWLSNNIPLSMINWYLVQFRTNNNAEAHNSALGKRFYAPHPRLYRFLSVLSEYHKSKMLDFRSIILGTVQPRKNSKYARLHTKLLSKQERIFEFDCIHYLRQLAHCSPSPRVPV
jgi:hypothetical protein